MATIRQQKWEQRADAVLGVASSIILMILMLLTVVDVVSRYLFNAPLRGAFEITELMLLVLIFAGLPLVSHADEHVTMDFIDRILGRRPLDIVVRLVHLGTAAAMFLLTWLMWDKAVRIGGYGQGGDTTDVLKVTVAPFVIFMAVMIAVTGIVHVYKFFIPGEARASQATS
jgi:TRAP-type C4-dicarboxylate transport system permease small subunit